MKKALYYIIPALFAMSALAFAQDTCNVTGRIYEVDGHTPASGAKIIVMSASRNGSVFVSTARSYTANPQGYISFRIPRSVGSDTAFVQIRGTDRTGQNDIAGFPKAGVIKACPFTLTATLSSLVTRANYNTYAILIPTLKAGTASTLYGTDSLVFAGTGVTVTNVEGKTTATITAGSGTYDSTTIYDGSHTWTQSQKTTHPGSATAPNIEFRPSTVTNRSVVPFTVWASDSSITPWSLKIIHNPANLVPNDNGYYAESLTLGLNSDAAWGTGERKWGGWLKMGEYFWHGYSAPEPVGRGPIQETHFEYLGENGVARRTWTQYNAISDGRGTVKETAYDVVSFHNGDGAAPVSTDSTCISFGSPRSVGVTYTPGTVELYKSSLRFNTDGAIYGNKISTKRPDSTAAYAPVFGGEDVGGFRGYYGTNINLNTSATSVGIPYVYIGARQVHADFDSPNSRVSISGANQFRSSASTFRDADSTAVATKNYVDVKAAGGSGVSATALRDTLDLNSRGYVRTNILTDSLSANTVRAESDPTATAKAQVVVKDSLDANSRGYVRTNVLTDSLNTIPRSGGGGLWVAGDSAAVLGTATAKAGAHIYGGLLLNGKVTATGANDVALYNFTGSTTTGLGLGNSATWALFAGGTKTLTGVSTLTYALTNFISTASIGVKRTGYTIGDSALTVGEAATTAGLHVYGGAKIEGDITGGALLRGIATIGANDSVDVTVTGMLASGTNAVTLSYRIGKTTTGTETMLSYRCTADNRLTIFGVATREVAYIRIK